jgi:cytochrome c556
MKLLPVSLCAAAALAAFSTVALRAETPAAPSPAQVVKARQAALEMSAVTFGSIKQALGEGADASKLGFQSGALAAWAAALPSLFPAGTAQGTAGLDTKAKAEIWTNRAGFEARAADYAAATAKLADLSKASDTPGFTAQLAVVKKACDACHADFKAH